MDQLPRLGKRELICLLSFTCNNVVSVRRVLLFLWVLGMGCVILLWHSLGHPLIILNDMCPKSYLNLVQKGQVHIILDIPISNSENQLFW